MSDATSETNSVYINQCQNCINKVLASDKHIRETEEKHFDKDYKRKNETAHSEYLASLHNNRMKTFLAQKQVHETLESQIAEKKAREENEKKPQTFNSILPRSEYEDKKRQLQQAYVKDVKSQMSKTQPKPHSPQKEFYKTTLDFSDSAPKDRDHILQSKAEYAKALQNQIIQRETSTKANQTHQKEEWANANAYVNTLEGEFKKLKRNEEVKVRNEYRAYLEKQLNQKEAQKRDFLKEKEEMHNINCAQKRADDEAKMIALKAKTQLQKNLSLSLQNQISEKEASRNVKEKPQEITHQEICKGECETCHRKYPLNLLSKQRVKGKKGI